MIDVVNVLTGLLVIAVLFLGVRFILRKRDEAQNRKRAERSFKKLF